MSEKQEVFNFLMEKMEIAAATATERGQTLSKIINSILSITHNHHQLLDTDKRRALSAEYHALASFMSGFSKDILHLLSDAETASRVKPATDFAISEKPKETKPNKK